jgi:tellurite methyltransferase
VSFATASAHFSHVSKDHGDRTAAWEAAYRKVNLLWGLSPDSVLQSYCTLVPKGTVLDLGIGEGRNAFPFAQMGHAVEGVDTSPTAVERCLSRAREAGYRVRAQVGDLRQFSIDPETYALVIAAWTLNFMKKSEAAEVIERVKKGLARDGLVYLGVFSTADPGFERIKQAGPEVEENTYVAPRLKGHVHYFTRPEVLGLFGDFRLVHCSEGKELDVGHGKQHYHGFVTYVGQKHA